MALRNHPLNALRAFEASARHLSYVKAAEELFVTPAALSHQVKRLEAYLGVPLFRRLPRGLLMTDAAQRLLPELRDAFLLIDEAVEKARASEQRGALTVSVAPMFTVKWLLPRLQRFETAHPDIDLRLSSSLELADFGRDGVDAAIRLGGGRYPGMHADKLFDESVTPMCSPRLLQGGTGAPDLAGLTLLHDDSLAFDASAPDWSSWFAAAGQPAADTSHGPRFGQPDHVLQAAIDGAGVALGWRFLARDDLTAKRLVAPFETSLPLGSAFYLVFPEGYASRPKLNIFRDWLLQEVAARS
ncbi:MAG: transcriptional regulator GcvA [Pseudomonadota bacterium]